MLMLSISFLCQEKINQLEQKKNTLSAKIKQLEMTSMISMSSPGHPKDIQLVNSQE